ncbi:phosphatase PAP2 family protein [Actinomycetospora sp. OC33-EN08]|uniref:Phosphatase PAP2 family protein n=1 Tax=Actinomycetospora aurantiaca TaxID=3129233 RepID=A0ABU8MSR9_9PSEU
MLDASGSREAAALVAIQHRIDQPTVVRAATGMSLFGEHAAGWLALGAAGAALDPTRRREWVSSAVAVAGAHGASIVLKRVVRRRRPHDPRIAVHVGTPSRLSFPSSHATSTTAAAVAYGSILGRRGALPLTAVIPAMALSRLVLGVHYPTDVLAGSALGAACALAARRVIERGRLGRWRTR